MGPFTLNKRELVDAKDWLLDICVSEDCIDYINQCDDFEIELLVSKRFEGGLKGFLESYGPDYEREV